MNNQYVIFEYNNTERRVFNSSINFLFSKVKSSSATVYIYDSFDKIKMKDGEFINYLNKTSLANTKYFRINYDDYFYRDNCIFYIVLYDNSSKYDDNIKVVNSLKYLDFGEEIKFTCSCSLLFNFLIEKDFPTYLHYQLRRYLFSYYYINITNEKGETLKNYKGHSASEYIKIEPSEKYYARIMIEKPASDLSDFDMQAFLLNYEKYGNNILIKDDNEINRTVLSTQNLTFFKSILNLEINDSIIITGCSTKSDIMGELWIKIYKRDDFESLIQYFPVDKNGFDYELEVERWYNFTFEIKKENEDQKGILLGFFVDQESMISTLDTEIHLRIYKGQPKGDDDKKNTGMSFQTIMTLVCVGVIVIGLIIGIYFSWKECKRICSRDENQSQNWNNIGNNYSNYNDITQKSAINDNNNSTSENNDNNAYYYNKTESNDGNGYDNCPAPTISEK